MRNADVVAARIAAWELFAANLQPLLEEMPYLQPFHDRIQVLVEEARELDERQEKVQAEARELTRRRQEVDREGDNLRARASAHLRAEFGFTSEHLIPFGITPRRLARRGEPDTAESSEPGGQ
jgi:hypothetical protein